MAQQATQGAWLADGDETNQHGNVVGHFVAHENGGRIGQAFSNCLVSDDTCRANARFMAAANPTSVLELLDYAESLEGLYRMHQQTETRAMRDLKTERDKLLADVNLLRADARVGADAYSSLLNSVRRAVGEDRFGPSRLQRMFLINFNRACRLIDEMTARGDVEADGEGYGRRFVSKDGTANG